MKHLLLAAGIAVAPIVAFSQPLFCPPVNLGPKINSQFYESDPFWDALRNRLYFVKAGPMTINGGEDIYFSDWSDTGWTDPAPIGGGINTGQIENSPSVSPDGQKLYFVCYSRPGSPYAWDIYVATWDSSLSNWGTPVNLGCPVSTPGVEFSAKIGPDGKTLYFYSIQSTCDSIMQFTGIVYSVRDSITGWSIPQSLGSFVNAGEGEEYPSVTQDHQWLYFDQIVSDGASIFVSHRTGSEWGQPIDLRPQIGERAGEPSITPSGDSLFFSTPLLNSLGNRDIFVMRRIATGVADNNYPAPHDFELYQNYPNPFNGETGIQLFVSTESKGPVSLTVYNILGQPVRQLLDKQVIKGKISQVWDGRDNSGREVSSGIYLYELRVGIRGSVKKAVLIR